MAQRSAGTKMTYVVKYNGEEVARVSGEDLVCCKKANRVGNTTDFEFVDDEKMLKIVRDGKSVLVLYVSVADAVTVEKLP